MRKKIGGKIARPNPSAIGSKGDQTLYEVFQLSDVAAPGTGFQNAHGIEAYAGHLLFEMSVQLGQKVIRKERDITFAPPQRGSSTGMTLSR